VPNHPVAGRIVRRLDCLDVGKTPAQSRGDDQNYGDRTEISGLVSSRRMLPHFSDHPELALIHFRIISSSPYSHGCSLSEQNWSLHPISLSLDTAKVGISGSMT
jgi:hypothetical protein